MRIPEPFDKIALAIVSLIAWLVMTCHGTCIAMAVGLNGDNSWERIFASTFGGVYGTITALFMLGVIIGRHRYDKLEPFQQVIIGMVNRATREASWSWRFWCRLTIEASRTASTDALIVHVYYDTVWSKTEVGKFIDDEGRLCFYDGSFRNDKQIALADPDCDRQLVAMFRQMLNQLLPAVYPSSPSVR